jgi:protein gp37
MGENSKIEWTTHTFNPWRGCTKVSEGCANCYAETLSKRNPAVLGQWGKGKPRVLASEAMWKQPLKWNAQAAGATERPRVFCASLADWLDDEVPLEWLARLLRLIDDTPQLDWLLLTKRPENWGRRFPQVLRHGDLHDPAGRWLRGYAPRNVWLGVSVENQKAADERIPLLVQIPAVVRFLSCEPLLGPVGIRQALPKPVANMHHIDWVIAGGESGPGARPMHPDWARGLRDQCQAAHVPFLFKQWGTWVPALDAEQDDPDGRADYRKMKREGCVVLNHAGGCGFHGERVHMMRPMSKKAAGRELDGRTWDEYPQS